MGRAPCCDKANVKKGPWSPEEDAKLKSYIEQHGTGGNWIALPQKIGNCRWFHLVISNLFHSISFLRNRGRVYQVQPFEEGIQSRILSWLAAKGGSNKIGAKCTRNYSISSSKWLTKLPNTFFDASYIHLCVLSSVVHSFLSGLKRCGKSCRLRWLNYLRPNIKHGAFSEEEDRIILSLYVSIGSRLVNCFLDTCLQYDELVSYAS